MSGRGSFYAVELYDPEDDKPLAFWQDDGVWVRDMGSAFMFTAIHLANAKHSTLSNHMLHVRVVAVTPE